MPVPLFTSEGLLPEGDHVATFDELRASHLVRGDGSSTTWDANWRLQLVDNAELLACQLWQIGISNIYLDGSFVEDADHPRDIDGYFECDKKKFITRGYEQELNAIAPKKVWNWYQRVLLPHIPGSKFHGELLMWLEYRVELYGYWPGQKVGILDAQGKELDFAEAFRQQKWTFAKKGVIKLAR